MVLGLGADIHKRLAQHLCDDGSVSDSARSHAGYHVHFLEVRLDDLDHRLADSLAELGIGQGLAVVAING